MKVKECLKNCSRLKKTKKTCQLNEILTNGHNLCGQKNKDGIDRNLKGLHNQWKTRGDEGGYSEKSKQLYTQLVKFEWIFRPGRNNCVVV
jgi:hypothetical protein